ncbi:hypothetical protein HMPREF0454_04066 [Hafnia alvei ATCC 51873]|uniref:Uncharacterized protein n=1 Tax=Hafnia alvei ATCC 51873 TaxID=1002364 RepID=G9YBN7_HAFAL|nr:hypothetical protein HMPREF0454_04066 [Hafnia alvei ATCC 51873]
MTLGHWRSAEVNVQKLICNLFTTNLLYSSVLSFSSPACNGYR